MYLSTLSRIARRRLSASIMALGGICLLQSCAASRIVNVSWTPPSTYVDGTPLSESDIAGYKLRCTKFTPAAGAARDCLIKEQFITSERNATPVNFTNIARRGGTYCFAMATVTRSDASSDWTNEACKTFPPL